MLAPALAACHNVIIIYMLRFILKTRRHTRTGIYVSSNRVVVRDDDRH